MRTLISFLACCLAASCAFTACASDVEGDLGQSEQDIVVGSIAYGQTVTVPVIGRESYRQLAFQAAEGDILEVEVKDVRHPNDVLARPVVQIQAGALTDLYEANSLPRGSAYVRARALAATSGFVAVASRASTSYEVTLRGRPCDPKRERCGPPPPSPPPPCTVTRWSCVYSGYSAGGSNNYRATGVAKDDACIAAKALCEERSPRLGRGCSYAGSAEIAVPCP